MFRTIILAICGLLASAFTKFEIPAEAFKAAFPKESLVKMQLYGSRVGSTAQNISWSECPSKRNYEVATGTITPNPPIIGEFLDLDIDVKFNGYANVVGNFISVKVTPDGQTLPIPLYSQDFPTSYPGIYIAGDRYNDGIAWLLPTFAPIGHYNFQVVVHGPNKDNDNYVCLEADFEVQA